MSLAGEHQGSPGRWTGWNPSEKNLLPREMISPEWVL